MVSDLLHTEGEKRDFTIILVYLLLTSTVSNVNFKNLIQPRAIDADDASDARLIANSPVEAAGLQVGGKVDGLRTDESNTIMSWLTSFSFFRPASNNLFTYFLQDQRSNGNDRRDDFDLSFLNNIPLPHAPEPRPTGDEDGGMDLDVLRMDGMSLFDFQEDFATGLSLGAGLQQEANAQGLAYARFNSFDQFLEFNSPEAELKPELAQSPNCICVDGKLVAFMDPLPTESTLQDGEESLPLADLLPRKVDPAAGCAVGTPCASQQNASTLLNDDQFVQLLTELEQTNAGEYEGLEQYAYMEQAQQATEVKPQHDIKHEATFWTNAPAAAAETHSSSSDHNYAAELNGEQRVYWPVTQMDQSAFDGATPSAPQVSDDESGVHTDEMLDFDPEQNAFGGFDQSPMHAAFVQAHMYNTPTTQLSPSLAELEELDECSDEIDEKSAYTTPKASYRSKRESGSEAAASWHESEDAGAEIDDTEVDDTQSMTMSAVTFSSANLPFSDHEIIHSSWARFEAMLRDRRLSASDLQIMKDIRRRGKNKIAAMNCRRRKQSRVDSLRDERVELNRENEQLEAELAHLREQANMYDARLERALRMLRESEGDVVLAARA